MKEQNMIQTYRYNELSDDAKEIAVEKVYAKECEFIPWDMYNDEIVEQAKEIAKEAGLIIDEIGWEREYSLQMDYRKGSLESNFFKKHLSPEQYQLLEDLENISCGYLEHRLFHPYETKHYALHFDYPGSIDDKILMDFFYKHAKEEEHEELKSQITMPHLLESSIEDDIELCDTLYDKCTPLAQELSEGINGVISSKVNDILDEIETMIDTSCEDLESSNFAKNNLESQGSFYEDYLFTEEGEICFESGETTKTFEYIE